MLYVKLLEKHIHNVHKHLFTCARSFSKHRSRKKVSVYPKRSDVFGDVRKTPAKLLKGNLFTPESAGFRELSMLCYWIVNYGYADSNILTRYLQCAINSLEKLNTKSLALILHSVSKYVYTYPTTQISLQRKPVIKDLSRQSESHENRILYENDRETLDNVSESSLDTAMQDIYSDADMNKYFKKDTKITSELIEYNNLLVKCMEMIEKMPTVLPRLLPRGSPKDLGMIALSVSNLYEAYIRDVDDALKVVEIKNVSESANTGTVKSLSDNTKKNDAKDEPSDAKRLWQNISKTLRSLSEEILPKLLFCEMEELAALAKTFSKYPELDFCAYFMKELSLEVSTVLLEKCEQMNDLLRNVYIGDDLVKSLYKLPRELTTIVCSMRKFNIKEKVFYERALSTVNFLIKVKKMDEIHPGSLYRNYNTSDYFTSGNVGEYLPIKPSEGLEYKESIESLKTTLDPQTLALLSTALACYGDVKNILEHILEIAKDTDLQSLATSVVVAVNSMDIDLAKRLLDRVDRSDISKINPITLSKFIRALPKIPSLDYGYTENIKNLIEKDCDVDTSASIYLYRDTFGIEKDDAVQLATKLSSEIDSMSLNTVIHLFYNITSAFSDVYSNEDDLFHKINSDSTSVSQNAVCSRMQHSDASSRFLKGSVIRVLNKRYIEIPAEHVVPVLKSTVSCHGDASNLILNLCKRISRELHLFQSADILDIYNELKGKGFNANKLFKDIIQKLQFDEYKNADTSVKESQSDDSPSEIADIYTHARISEERKEIITDYTPAYTDSVSYTLHPGSDSDVEMIANVAKAAKDVTPLNIEDFKVHENEYEHIGMRFELNTFYDDCVEHGDEQKRKAIWPKGTRPEDLQSEWSSHRPT